MSLNKIRIPESQRENFKFFLKLPKEVQGEIIEFIQNVPLGLSNNALLHRAFEEIKNLSKEKIIKILSIYFSLSAVKEDFGYSDDEFIENLNESLLDLGDEELIPDDNHLDVFRQFFKTDSKISLSRKVVNDSIININNFDSVKTITNIRPSFDEDEKLIGSSILTDLNIIYDNDDELKSFFVTLDESDINSLIKVLNKEKEKINLIKKQYSNLNIIEILK